MLQGHAVISQAQPAGRSRTRQQQAAQFLLFLGTECALGLQFLDALLAGLAFQLRQCVVDFLLPGGGIAGDVDEGELLQCGGFLAPGEVFD